MPKQALTIKSYPALVKQIQAELSDLDFFVKRRTAEAYWKTGKFIHEHLLEHKERADYGTTLFEKLAEDVGRSKSTFQRAVQFYRTYPIVAEPRQLTWEHYRSLITVHDKNKREAFEKIAFKREWTSEKLEDAIRLDRLKIEEPTEKPTPSSAKLSVIRSRLYTYKILEPGYIHPVDEYLVVDLGFNFLINAEIKGLRLKEGDIVESEKEEGKPAGGGSAFGGYSFTRSSAKPKELYTYVALVERVVDGDTIWLNIDCGFKVWTRQKVRLRGIDCPELTTKEGIEAKKFVEAKLKEVEFVVIKTHQSDKYDRYLADIFYLKDEKQAQKVLEEGIFLNQELLDLNLARVWVE